MSFKNFVSKKIVSERGAERVDQGCYVEFKAATVLLVFVKGISTESRTHSIVDKACSHYPWKRN